MNFVYTFFISFLLVFLSELGDKTQLLVLSFSTKNRAKNILLGVAIGTFLSHGLAILFGSKLSSLGNEDFQFYLKIFTYASFILFGIAGFIPSGSLKSKLNNRENLDNKTFKNNSSSKLRSFCEKFSIKNVLHKFSEINFIKSCVFVVAFSIVVGELGDKTFLASLGLGVQYPNYKISLILGSISGMLLSNSFALFVGRFLGNKFTPNFVKVLSNILFLIFGVFGFVSLFV